MNILSELRRPVGLRQRVYAVQATDLTDQGEMARILQGQAGGVRRRQLAGQRRKLTEPCFAAACGMADLARLHGDFFR
ncbi:hypothetical protein D3C71_1365130 [compost metagenome]